MGMSLDEKASMARKLNCRDHLGKLQHELLQFSLLGFKMEGDLELDVIYSTTKKLDSQIDQWAEKFNKKAEEIKNKSLSEPGADVETSAPGLN